jgi:hypothetical protein
MEKAAKMNRLVAFGNDLLNGVAERRWLPLRDPGQNQTIGAQYVRDGEIGFAGVATPCISQRKAVDYARALHDVDASNVVVVI